MHDPLRSHECSKFLKALADTERLHIVQCLRSGEKTVGDVSRVLAVPLANASHHLQLLKRAGIAASHKEGRFVFYALAPAILKQVAGAKGGGAVDVLDFGCCRVELGAR